MADTPIPKLVFEGRCPDCGQRQVTLPAEEPSLGDDFPWQARDYDAIRIAMLEELAARFPERQRWTPADLEVVLVEVLASALDQLSDMADRVTAESCLESARRPESVRRLLAFIGYDAVTLAGLVDDPPSQPGALSAIAQLERSWTEEPLLMEQARRAGPRSVRNQRRMVTVEDYTVRLEEHPLIRRAAATMLWTGSWHTINVAVVLPWTGVTLDIPETFHGDTRVRSAVEDFHVKRGLPLPDWYTSPAPTHRMILEPYLDAYRMAGQEVILEDAVPVGIAIDLAVEVRPDYFQSEVRRALIDVLGTGSHGFFEPGRLRFGEDLHASDLFQLLLAVEGVANICLQRFKRIGNQFPDCAATGEIRLEGLEIAVCDNDPRQPSRGFYRLTLHGGRRG